MRASLGHVAFPIVCLISPERANKSDKRQTGRQRLGRLIKRASDVERPSYRREGNPLTDQRLPRVSRKLINLTDGLFLCRSSGVLVCVCMCMFITILCCLSSVVSCQLSYEGGVVAALSFSAVCLSRYLCDAGEHLKG